MKVIRAASRCKPVATSAAGDSRRSATSDLYVTPTSRTFEPFTALPTSFKTSCARLTTYAGIPALMLMALASEMNLDAPPC
jgi:hypothetical protein